MNDPLQDLDGETHVGGLGPACAVLESGMAGRTSPLDGRGA